MTRLLFAALMLSAPPALAGTCDAVMNGQLKSLTMPEHTVSTFETKGRSFTFESIAAGGKIHSHLKDGRWKVAKQSQNEASIVKAWGNNDSCRPDGTEEIDGDMTDILLNHDGGIPPIDTRFWISRSSGLIVKTQSNMTNSVLTVVYDTKGVEVPADAPAPP